MRIATYNILKGGSKRAHWQRMIDDQSVELLLVQESYPHDEHLPPLLYPHHAGKSAWSNAGDNSWGSGVFSATGQMTRVPIEGYDGGVWDFQEMK